MGDRYFKDDFGSRWVFGNQNRYAFKKGDSLEAYFEKAWATPEALMKMGYDGLVECDVNWNPLSEPAPVPVKPIDPVPASGGYLRLSIARQLLVAQVQCGGMEGCEPDHLVGMAFELADKLIAGNK